MEPRMSSALIQQLLERYGYPEIDETSLDDFLDRPGVHVLFFTGDPRQYRETNDVAVVLPELVKAFADRLHPGVVARSAEAALQRRYGFRRWPALVFLRREGYLGAITGIQNWSDYLQEVTTLLAADPCRPPGFSVPVASE
jgi:hydrogenase-1 operon protein HyaE